MRVLAVIGAVLAAVVYLIEKNLDSFYIFQTDHLHDLVKRSVATHGNDTRAIVNAITAELRGTGELSTYMSTDQQWFFNNAGGAMGGMTILHASGCFGERERGREVAPANLKRRHHRVPDLLR